MQLDAQKRRYWCAQGLQPWVLRMPLPFAKPSRVQSTHPALIKAPRIEPVFAAVSEAISEAISEPIVAVADNTPRASALITERVSGLVEQLSLAGSASRPAAKQVVRDESALRQSGSVSSAAFVETMMGSGFAVVIQPVFAHTVILAEAADPGAPCLAVAEQALLNKMVAAWCLQCPEEPRAVAGESFFSWPIALHRTTRWSRADACAALTGVCAALKQQGVMQAIILGESLASLLFPESESSECESSAVMPPIRCYPLPSLMDLLEQPFLKKQVWATMQRVVRV